MEKKISIESLIKSINQEIDWCEENKELLSELDISVIRSCEMFLREKPKRCID